MLRSLRFLSLIACLAAAGCGPRPVTGGTPGMLRAAGEPLGDIQVTVHQVEAGSPRAIGFGVSAADGSFHLVMNEARGPLVLAPGEYRFTLESAGAPVQIPTEYTQAETTPLAITLLESDKNLTLEIPVRFYTQ